MLSTILGVVGLVIALYQIRRVERAALAAKRAAENTIQQVNTYAVLLSIPELVLLEREIELLSQSNNGPQTSNSLRNWQARASELIGLLKERSSHEVGLDVAVQNSVVLAASACILISKDKVSALQATARFRTSAMDVVNLARQEGARIRANIPAPEPLPTFADDCRNLWAQIRRVGNGG